MLLVRGARVVDVRLRTVAGCFFDSRVDIFTFRLQGTGGPTTVTIVGGPNPETWQYELTLPGPSETLTRRLSGGQVLHIFYARGPTNPWRGISPIEASGATRKLLDNLELRLAQETGEAVGHLIPVPNVTSTNQLQADIRAMKGAATLVESTASGWGTGASAAPVADYPVRRIGANPPETLANLRRQTEQSILAACGVPTSVLDSGQGTASREVANSCT